MANLTGRFIADFAPFNQAVEEAVVTLKGLESGGENVEASLNRMVDNFSGRKLIQDANLMVEAIERLGGTSQLTEKELAAVGSKAAEAAEKMKALGLEVSPEMQKLADTTKSVGQEGTKTSDIMGELSGRLAGMFTVGAIIAFGQEVLETGDRIQKMADQTGLAVDQVQQLQYISGQSGTEMSSMVRAIQDMQEKLGRGDAGLIGGIKNLGINLDSFRQMNAYDQFIAIGDAVGKIEDPTRQAAAAADVFGRNWRELLPALKSDMKALADETVFMSAEAVAGLDALGDGWDALKGRTIANVGEITSQLIGLGDKWEKLWNPSGEGQSAQDIWRQTLAGDIDGVAAALAKVPPVAIATGDAIANFAVSAEEAARLSKELDRDTQKLADEALKDAEDAARKYAEELARFEEAYIKVNDQGRGYEAILAEIDESLTAHITGLLEAGASVDDLALAYSLSKVQVTAMKDALEDATAAQKLADDATRETIALQDELYLMAIERSGTASDAQRAHIQRWGDDYKQHLADAGTATQEAYDLIDQIVGERTSDMMVDWNEVKQHSHAALQETADIARANYEAMVADAGNYSIDTIRAFEQTAIAAQEAADQWSASFSAAADDMEAAAGRASLSWSEAMDLVGKGQGTMTGTVGGGAKSAYWGSTDHAAAVQEAYNAGRYFGPVVVSKDGRSLGPDYEGLGIPAPAGGGLLGRASGGPVSAGQPYMVGERGPELFLPTQAGSILPHGASSGVVQNIVFNVNGTGADVARVVSEEMTRLMRVGRKWPAV